MKVRELIILLQEQDQEATVFVSAEEDDATAKKVIAINMDEIDGYQVSEYYCQGDSLVAINAQEGRIKSAVTIKGDMSILPTDFTFQREVLQTTSKWIWNNKV